MEKKSYGMLDVAKFISALLVIAIHCAPFIEINETLNFVYVQIIARLAVPFFFMASGWLFFRKIDASAGWRDENNLCQLKHYWKRIARIYIIWSLLYVPLLALSWIQGGFAMATLLRLVRDFLFNGTYYHLWFLSALLWGVPMVYWMYTNWRRQAVLIVSLLLYVIGMAVNVYGVLLMNIPIIGPLLKLYESVLVTTRNGFFFAPIFLTLGIYVDEFVGGRYKKQSVLAFLISFAAYTGEALALRHMGIMNDLTSMYALLIPAVFFLFMFLMQFSFRSNFILEGMRKQSLLIYVSHIYFVYIWLYIFPNAHLWVYLLSILCSYVFSVLVLKLVRRWPRCKVLM